jgi:hypothetical protein
VLHVHWTSGLGSWVLIKGIGSLHEAAASSAIFASALAHIDGSLRRPACDWRHHSGPTLALTLWAAQCIKRRRFPATKSRALTQPVRARSVQRGAETLETRIASSLPSSFFQATAVAVSKCVPSFHIRPRSTASFLATATRAFFGPSVFRSFNPQLRKAKRFLTVVSSTLAASYK